jgi:hypothetical protein
MMNRLISNADIVIEFGSTHHKVWTDPQKADSKGEYTDKKLAGKPSHQAGELPLMSIHHGLTLPHRFLAV